MLAGNLRQGLDAGICFRNHRLSVLFGQLLGQQVQSIVTNLSNSLGVYAWWLRPEDIDIYQARGNETGVQLKLASTDCLLQPLSKCGTAALPPHPPTAYHAPEVLRGEGYGERAAVWNTALLRHMCICGATHELLHARGLPGCAAGLAKPMYNTLRM